MPDNDPEGRIEVAVNATTLFVKVYGLAKQDNCLGMPDLIQAMIAQGCDAVCYDMSECSGMDSTFMGVLAYSAATFNKTPRKRVFLVNASERIERQLRKIGVLPMVELRRHAGSVPRLEFKPVEDLHFPEGELERLATIKAMHEELVKLNEENRIQFGEFIEAIEQDLGS